MVARCPESRRIPGYGRRQRTGERASHQRQDHRRSLRPVPQSVRPRRSHLFHMGHYLPVAGYIFGIRFDRCCRER